MLDDGDCSVPLMSARGVLDAGCSSRSLVAARQWKYSESCNRYSESGASWPLTPRVGDLSPTVSRPVRDSLSPPPATRETRIEVVDVETSVSPPCLFYKIAVCAIVAGSATRPHHVRRRAADIQDFHAALQRELGFGKSSASQLPPLPVLFEFQTRLMGCQCQKVLNAYFRRLVRNQSVVETYTFQNFFQDRQLADTGTPVRSPQGTCSSLSEGAWLLSPDSPPLPPASERASLPRDSQPEEEPMVVTEGKTTSSSRDTSLALVARPQADNVDASSVKTVAVHPPRTVLKGVHTGAEPFDMAADKPNRGSFPALAELSDLLSEMKAQNTELTTRLLNMEAALIACRNKEAATLRSIAEPCPEPPRACEA